VSGVTIKHNTLGRIAAGLTPKLSQVVQKTGFDMVETEQALSRVATGAMRAGWTFEMTDDLHGVNYNPVEYTVYNEYGTSSTAAQPMATPAADQHRGPMLAAIKQALES
jgi:hypothetical protein